MTSKYANLPDIDSARDVYETEDVDQASSREKAQSDDDEPIISKDPGASPEELDKGRLPDRDEVGKFFRKAERRKPRRTVYTYPPSPTRSRSPSPSDPSSAAARGPPLRTRLRALQDELAALENELSDPSNPLLIQDADGDGVDTGEMLKGLVEVRAKLGSLSGGHTLGGKREELIEKVITSGKVPRPSTPKQAERPHHGRSTSAVSIGDNKTLAELDHRVADLEKLIGSNNTALDESSPLPPPLLPQINRLSNQLTLLTQPRHIESISRRLKLLLADLDRHQGAGKRASATTGSSKDKDKDASAAPPSALPPDLAPILQRLSPLLPSIPHLLQRLRTLSTLHTSASSFATTLASLEEEQKRVHGALVELGDAVKGVEKSIGDNNTRVEGNLKGMEARFDDLMARLALLSSDAP